MLEIFKKIPGFEDYAISRNGEVISLKCNKKEYLYPWINQGYRQISLYKNRIHHTFIIGTLMLITFIGLCPEGKEVSHLNGDSLDDRIKNLKWETHQENEFRKKEHGTSNDHKGKKNPNVKLTEKDILQIRELLKQEKYTQEAIANYFNILQPHISNIKNNRRWKYIQC